jgi:hypothetical protein
VSDSPIELTPEQIEQARERWPDLDETEQKRRMTLSLRAKAKHDEIVDPETGRRAFGGPQPGSGRKPKKRVAEKIAELAQGERQKEVIDALFSGLHQDNSPAIRAATAAKIIGVEHQERELQLKEDEFQGMPKDELKRLVAAGFMRMIERGEMPDLRTLIPSSTQGKDGRQPYDIEGSASDVDEPTADAA